MCRTQLKEKKGERRRFHSNKFKQQKVREEKNKHRIMRPKHAHLTNSASSSVTVEKRSRQLEQACNPCIYRFTNTQCEQLCARIDQMISRMAANYIIIYPLYETVCVWFHFVSLAMRL